MAAPAHKRIAPFTATSPTENALNQSLREAEVASIMTQSVICVTRSWTLRALLLLLADGDMGGVPVVDDGWRAVGIVSKSDVVRYVSQFGVPEGATVADVMLPMAMTVKPSMPIARVAALMACEGIHRLPVCGPAGDIVGIVTTLDIARWIAKAAGYGMAA